MRQSPDNHVYFLMEKGSKYPDVYNPADDSRMENINDYQYADYDEYIEKALALVRGVQPDIIISAAAISDFVCEKQNGKISSDGETMTIELKKAKKVIKEMREACPKAFMVGFKCLVDPEKEQVMEAVDKVLGYADIVVYNDLARLRQGDTKRTVFSRNSTGHLSLYFCEDANRLLQVMKVLKTAKGK